MDQQFRKSALTIGVRMAALSGAMVLVGAVLFSAALWWKVTRGPGEPESVPSVTLTLDVVDLAVAFAAVGVLAVAAAGGAAFLFSRQATKPLELAMERQRNFIADASHELRTPLSTMRMRVQQLQMFNSDDTLRRSLRSGAATPQEWSRSWAASWPSPLLSRVRAAPRLSTPPAPQPETWGRRRFRWA